MHYGYFGCCIAERDWYGQCPILLSLPARRNHSRKMFLERRLVRDWLRMVVESWSSDDNFSFDLLPFLREILIIVDSRAVIARSSVAAFQIVE
jgi:hypothetical protein